MNSDRTVLVFGTFDDLHPGHRYFLQNARTYGTSLITVVAPDEFVMTRKGRPPVRSCSQRIERIQNEDLADMVVQGDEVEGSWDVLRVYKPDIIALGYDQKALADALRLVGLGYKPEIVWIEAFEPDRYHSRFLRAD